MGSLTDVVQEFNFGNSGMLKIVPTGGLIVSERDVTPLSTQVTESLVELLWQKENGTAKTNLCRLGLLIQRSICQQPAQCSSNNGDLVRRYRLSYSGCRYTLNLPGERA
jgi:hypothetical protein